jgi:CheY-like chemotaxis protein
MNTTGGLASRLNTNNNSNLNSRNNINMIIDIHPAEFNNNDNNNTDNHPVLSPILQSPSNMQLTIANNSTNTVTTNTNFLSVQSSGSAIHVPNDANNANNLGLSSNPLSMNNNYLSINTNNPNLLSASANVNSTNAFLSVNTNGVSGDSVLHSGRISMPISPMNMANSPTNISSNNANSSGNNPNNPTTDPAASANFYNPLMVGINTTSSSDTSNSSLTPTHINAQFSSQRGKLLITSNLSTPRFNGIGPKNNNIKVRDSQDELAIPSTIKESISNISGNNVDVNNKGSPQPLNTPANTTSINNSTEGIGSLEQSKAIFRISVIDSGVGITQENQSKLFQPYIQILPNEQQQGKGTGLGLNISKSLVELHHGKIGFQTPSRGTGSEFYFELELPIQVRKSKSASIHVSNHLHPDNALAAALIQSGFAISQLHNKNDVNLEDNATAPFHNSTDILSNKNITNELKEGITNENVTTPPLLPTNSLKIPISRNTSSTATGNMLNTPTNLNLAANTTYPNSRATTVNGGFTSPKNSSIDFADSPELGENQYRKLRSLTTIAAINSHKSNIPLYPRAITVNHLISSTPENLTPEPDTPTTANIYNNLKEKGLLNTDNIISQILGNNVTDGNHSTNNSNTDLPAPPTFEPAPPMPHTPTNNNHTQAKISPNKFRIKSNKVFPVNNITTSHQLPNAPIITKYNTEPQLSTRIQVQPSSSHSLENNDINNAVNNNNTNNNFGSTFNGNSKTKRILVAEDSAPNRKLLIMLLKRLQYDAAGVENGQLAVEEFRLFANNIDGNISSVPYDLILMDGNMPIKDGKTATAELRAMNINIPIIAVTGNAMSEDVAEFLAAGANDLLTKPVNEKLLKKTLQQYLP